jgi:hypothetical protein
LATSASNGARSARCRPTARPGSAWPRFPGRRSTASRARYRIEGEEFDRFADLIQAMDDRIRGLSRQAVAAVTKNPMPSVDVIRNVTMRGKADGVDDATAALNR